jgi:DNA topoisomerase VI subunit B
MSDEKT